MANTEVIAVLKLRDNLSQGLKDVANNFDRLGRQTQGVGGQFLGLGKNVLGFGATMAKVGAGAALGFGAVISGIGVSVTKTAISFESAFAGIEKTVDGLDDTVAGSTQTWREFLQDAIRQTAKEIPVTFEELSKIGELGGQLGIPKEAIIDFTKTIAALGVSTNLTQEEAATALARMSNIFAISSEDMGDNIAKLGASIVDLGNNFATTEADIVEFGLRLAGAGKIVGLSQADILGIGTALSSVGVQAEAGGTAVQKTLLAINSAVAGASTGFVDNTDAIDKNVSKIQDLNATLVKLEYQTGVSGNELWSQYEAFLAAGGSAEEFGRQLGDTRRAQLFKTVRSLQELTEETELLRSMQGQPISPKMLTTLAKTAGLTAGEFSDLWEKDAARAFQMFVEGLGAAGDDAVNILEELDLTDVRLTRSLLSLANAGDLLDKTLTTSRDAWEDQTALTIEAEKRYKTAESQIQIFKNTIRDLGITFGTYVLPYLGEFLDFARPMVEEFGRRLPSVIEAFAEKIKGLIEAFRTGGAAGLAEALGFSPQAISQIEAMGERIAQAIDFIGQHWEAFKGALIGVGAVLAAAGIAASIVGIAGTIAALANPITLIIAAAALLGAAWTENWGGIRDILTDFWENTGRPIFNQLVEWLQTNIPVAIDMLSAFWTNTLLPALSTVWAFINDSVIPTIGDLVTWLQENVPIAVQAASEFWQTTLFPALQTVADFIKTVIIPAISNLIAWLQTSIPIAIQAASDFWQTTLLPALQAVGNFITGTLVPIFANIIEWLQTNIPLAIQTLTEFWQEKLLPAITNVWQFISEKLVPLFQALANVGIALVSHQIEVLSAIWTNILLPALQDVWNFINENIIPIFETLGGLVLLGLKTTVEELSSMWTTILLPALQEVWGFISEQLGPVFEWLSDEILGPIREKFDSLREGIEGINDPIEALTEWLNNLAEKINTLELPAWLQGGSPPPLADWLRDISEAAEGAGTNLGSMLSNFATTATQNVGQFFGNLFGGKGGGGEDQAAQAEAFTQPANQIAAGLRLALPIAIAEANLGTVVVDSISMGIENNEDAKQRMARVIAQGMLTYMTDEMAGVGTEMINFLVAAVSKRLGVLTGAEVRP